ncbi:Pyrimidine-specific ribonucleoside hydrolase RihB [Halioglobus japonicus]|nr:Pyrimidine-specific ribonucleoside hydrolase RihB [Halioglobus japonicus]
MKTPLLSLTFTFMLALLVAACSSGSASNPDEGLAEADVNIDPAVLIPREGMLEVVIDTDLTNEIDDEFALVQAILSPERLNIRAIYAAPYALSEEIVRRGALTELGIRKLEESLMSVGLDLSVIPDVEPGPSMEQAFDMAIHISELTGFTPDQGIHRGSDRFLTDIVTPVMSDAANNLVALAQEERESRLVVVANGAITNVASALLIDPSIAEDIVIVWTAAYPSFWPHPNNSFNLVQDIDAARVVFESGAPVVYIPGYFVGEKLRVSLPEMREHIEGRGDIGDFLFELYSGLDNSGARTKVIWDMVTVGYLLDPTGFDERVVAPMTLGDDRRWIPGTGLPVVEPIDFDRDLIFADFYTKLAAQAE